MKEYFKILFSFAFVLWCMCSSIQAADKTTAADPEALAALVGDLSLFEKPKKSGVDRVRDSHNALLRAAQGKCAAKREPSSKIRSQSAPTVDDTARPLSPIARPISVPPGCGAPVSPIHVHAMGKSPEIDRLNEASPLAKTFALSGKIHELLQAGIIKVQDAMSLRARLRAGKIDEVEKEVFDLEYPAEGISKGVMVSEAIDRLFDDASSADDASALGAALEHARAELTFLFQGVGSDFGHYLEIFLEELLLVRTLGQLKGLLSIANKYAAASPKR